MKVSIITPSYNSALYIEKTIASVQAQTLTDWEMIIVDDGSTDNSVEIIKNISTKDARIKLIQKENGGSASARRHGMSFAKGDYIQFLDADDTIDNEKLIRQTSLMDTKLLDISYTDWCFVHLDGTTEQVHGLNFTLPRVLLFWGTLFGALPIHAFLYRRAYLEKNNISFVTSVKEREDWNFHIQVLSNHPSITRQKGYCGAYYLRCPTGKTSSFGKIQKGTIRFLLFKIRETNYLKRALLTLRLSIVLVEMFVPALKQKINIRKDIMPLFYSSCFNMMVFLAALLLLPIAIIIFAVRVLYLQLKRI